MSANFSTLVRIVSGLPSDIRITALVISNAIFDSSAALATGVRLVRFCIALVILPINPVACVGCAGCSSLYLPSGVNPAVFRCASVSVSTFTAFSPSSPRNTFLWISANSVSPPVFCLLDSALRGNGAILSPAFISVAVCNGWFPVIFAYVLTTEFWILPA